MRGALVLTVAAACETPPLAIDCGTMTGEVRGQIVSGDSTALVTKDLTVRGTVSSTDGRTIRRVLVAGIAAENEGFNFEQWSVVIPIGVLSRQMTGTDEGNDIDIKATAVDGCEVEHVLDSIEVSVDSMPEIVVDSLMLSVTYSGADQPRDFFIPADSSASAQIRIVGNAAARGAAVTLTTTAGRFSGTEAGNIVHLAATESGISSATAILTADLPEDSIVSAQGKTAAALPIVVKAAGAPMMIPAEVLLDAGHSIPIAVFSDGNVEACQATIAAGLTVFSGKANLMAGDAVTDDNHDGRIDNDIVVTAAPSLPDAVETTITCRDRYGQMATAKVSAAPPAVH